MPCCGITIEYIYARLKAAEVPGSGTADRLLDELLSFGEGEPANGAEKRTEDKNTGDGKHRCRESIATS